MSRRLNRAAVALLLAANLAHGAAADAGAGRLRSFLADVRTLEGRFRQQVLDSRGQLVEETRGTVVLDRPGRFRWNYAAPFERVIVSDGDKVWLYEADLDQVTVRRLSSGIGDTPAALLTGQEAVLERFRIERSWSDGGRDLVRLVPRSADADFAGVTLAFDGRLLTQLLLDDRLGQQTRIDFDGVRLNPSLAPDVFRFVPPAGADVIDDTEL